MDSSDEGWDEDDYEDNISFEEPPGGPSPFHGAKPEIMNGQQILERQRQEAKKVADILSLPEEEAFVLCAKNDWHVEALLEKFCEGEELEVGRGNADTRPTHMAECSICFDPSPAGGFWRDPACSPSHSFCKDCWGTHIAFKIKDGSHLIPCMETTCKNFLSDQDFIRSVVPEDLFKLHQYLHAKAYVSSQKLVRWCPNPGCSNAVFSRSESLSVDCVCGFSFCVKCGNESHGPVSCEVLRTWQAKLEKEGSNLEWVSMFSKPCPNPDCGVPIQKNGGCQFMNCAVCRNYFCWSCLKALSKDHEAHDCKKEEPSNQAKASLAQLQSLAHCFEGFEKYHKKQKELHLLKPVLSRKQCVFNEMVDGCTEAFYLEGLQEFSKGISFAKFSYVVQYSISNNPQDLPLFLFHQSDLIQQLQLLEGLLRTEKPDPKDRQRLKDVGASLQLRVRALCRTVEEGFAQNPELYKIQPASLQKC